MPTMKLWLLERTDEGRIGWDEYDAMVVRATSPKKARALAEEKAGGTYWCGRYVKCWRLREVGGEGVLVGSFNAG